MKHVTLAIICGVLACGATLAIAQRSTPETVKPTTPRGAWVPVDEERSTYRDIVDYNIFRADRSAIANKVDRDRNPPKPTDPKPVVEKPVQAPADPDASWLLVGLSHDKDGPVAYIENAKTGENLRLNGPAEFSKGEVTAVGYDAVSYEIQGQQRIIRVGQNFVGSQAQHAGETSGSSSSSKASKSASPQERLRALREQRERELAGETPKPEAPTPTDASETTKPDSTTEPNDADDDAPQDGFDTIDDQPTNE